MHMDRGAVSRVSTDGRRRSRQTHRSVPKKKPETTLTHRVFSHPPPRPPRPRPSLTRIVDSKHSAGAREFPKQPGGLVIYSTRLFLHPHRDCQLTAEMETLIEARSRARCHDGGRQMASIPLGAHGGGIVRDWRGSPGSHGLSGVVLD